MIKPWGKIQQQYEEIAEIHPYMSSMRDFVRHIAQGDLGQALFAWTSMHDLCIVQTRVQHPYIGPYLKVSPLKSGEIEFRYVDTYVDERQWVRTVPGGDAIQRLHQFIEQLHWEVREVAFNHSLQARRP